jgi:O-methyltransferase involved in polyketide biosynthesis
MSDADRPVLVGSQIEAQRIFQASISKPHVGRIYDYYLGGKHNYAVDREFAKQQITAIPDIPRAAQENRGFLQRAVRLMMAQGIRQFVDFGSGLPTQGNVHEVAAGCRVAYVDQDPVASAHSFLVLSDAAELSRALPINGDLLLYDSLWDVAVSELIDPSQPVGLLMMAVLHCLPDDQNPHEAVEFYKDKAPTGSYLAISHASTEGMPAEAKESLARVLKNYDQTTTRAVGRSRAEVAEFFRGWELLNPPGIVWTPQWHAPEAEPDTSADTADDEPWRSQAVAGVARKP